MLRNLIFLGLILSTNCFSPPILEKIAFFIFGARKKYENNEFDTAIENLKNICKYNGKLSMAIPDLLPKIFLAVDKESIISQNNTGFTIMIFKKYCIQIETPKDEDLGVWLQWIIDNNFYSPDIFNFLQMIDKCIISISQTKSVCIHLGNELEVVVPDLNFAKKLFFILDKSQDYSDIYKNLRNIQKVRDEDKIKKTIALINTEYDLLFQRPDEQIKKVESFEKVEIDPTDNRKMIVRARQESASSSAGR